MQAYKQLRVCLQLYQGSLPPVAWVQLDCTVCGVFGPRSRVPSQLLRRPSGGHVDWSLEHRGGLLLRPLGPLPPLRTVPDAARGVFSESPFRLSSFDFD